MPDKHAILSASGSHRWLNCTPSARLELEFENQSTEAASEGTAAHALCEHKLKKALRMRSKRPTSDYDSDEMEECTDAYVEFVMEQYEKAKQNCADPIILIEQHLDFSCYVPDGFGTGDCIIIADDTLHIIDFKYGKHREGFNRMIDDALAGKIDLIVTKSVSRFARNTVDSLVTVRKLKEKGVEVFFEKENIYTLDSKGELLITIMSSLAQEESRSISENVTWGHRKRFSDGKLMLPYKNFLGYEKGPDGLPQIVESEAKIVRRIYDLFLSGITTCSIAKMLMDEGIKSPSGCDCWRTSTVDSILQNEKYKGSALLQKSYTIDFLTKKQKVNEGEIPQYYVENSHPAIIDPQMWELTQIEFDRRKAIGKEYSCNSIFSARLICENCGHYYMKRAWSNKFKDSSVVWICKHRYKHGKDCDSPIVQNSDVESKFVEALNEIIDNREIVLSRCRELLDELDDNTAIDEEIDEHLRECEIIVGLNKKLIEENTARAMNQDEFNKKYAAYEARYNAEHTKVEELKAAKEARQKRAEILSAFMFEIHERESLIEKFDKKLWLATIDTVTVLKDGRLKFNFKNGKEVIK